MRSRVEDATKSSWTCLRILGQVSWESRHVRRFSQVVRPTAENQGLNKLTSGQAVFVKPRGGLPECGIKDNGAVATG
jgi:hypothetical protein